MCGALPSGRVGFVVVAVPGCCLRPAPAGAGKVRACPAQYHTVDRAVLGAWVDERSVQQYRPEQAGGLGHVLVRFGFDGLVQLVRFETELLADHAAVGQQALPVEGGILAAVFGVGGCQGGLTPLQCRLRLRGGRLRQQFRHLVVDPQIRGCRGIQLGAQRVPRRVALVGAAQRVQLLGDADPGAAGLLSATLQGAMEQRERLCVVARLRPFPSGVDQGAEDVRVSVVVACPTEVPVMKATLVAAPRH
ncbi:hypothetical protein EEJ42_07415 [Streptomyces botrytidirepellens]|uniref:Uncharacterized protein n=1 Tax=Streptomyces botrytidirepellens TaxID=2486417 RepID=A0A3M8WVT4_9ACTN|nr:hypothetical protein EEJ42_07415 [Streptomyces botrytidirepellens]